jgi:hypothetical protein
MPEAYNTLNAAVWACYIFSALCLINSATIVWRVAAMRGKRVRARGAYTLLAVMNGVVTLGAIVGAIWISVRNQTLRETFLNTVATHTYAPQLIYPMLQEAGRTAMTALLWEDVMVLMMAALGIIWGTLKRRAQREAGAALAGDHSA